MTQTTYPKNPSEPNLQMVLAGQLRDYLFETLKPVEHEAVAACASLEADDDAGTVYHFRRMLARVREAGEVVLELEGRLSGRAA
jgi:hypothetical protein